MTKLIAYKNENGGVSIITPAPDCPLTLEEIAAKDVPTGVPYKIMDDTDFPTERTFRDAWELELDRIDGVGA